MCQSVFNRGSLVAFHANLRIGEGANGSASHKRSIDLPEARNWLDVLGTDLEWHGALSADVILTNAGPVFIDINPRLVEPENAWLAGVDLVGAMLDVATAANPPRQADGKTGVATHQLLLALLGAAQRRNGRKGVIKELLAAWRSIGAYADSVEELTPAQHDLMALVPLALASVAILIKPTSWSWFSSGSVENYALTADGWKEILAMTDDCSTRRPGELKALGHSIVSLPWSPVTCESRVNMPVLAIYCRKVAIRYLLSRWIKMFECPGGRTTDLTLTVPA